MPQKTYVPAARITINKLHEYLTRYAEQIQANVEPDVWTCLSDLITALAQCIVVLGKRAKE
jgi:hypothetical protein